MEDSLTAALFLDQLQTVNHKCTLSSADFRSNITAHFMLASEVDQRSLGRQPRTKILDRPAVPGRELAVVICFEHQSDEAPVEKFSGVFRLEPDHLATQKLLFVIGSLAIGLLNMAAIRNTYQSVVSDRGLAFSFSNYIVIVMAGIDVYYCFMYALLGIIMGTGYYKFALCVAFIYLLLFIVFDLRLFHAITAACLEQAGANDVDSCQEDARTFRRRVCVYNLKHYICLFVSFVIVVKFPLSKTAFYMFGVLPVFQVVQNLVCKLAYLPEQFDLMLALLLKSFLFVDAPDPGVPARLSEQHPGDLHTAGARGADLGVVRADGRLD